MRKYPRRNPGTESPDSVWDISVEGNFRFTEETILHYLDTLPVSCGMLRSKVSCSFIEESLKDQFPEISWVSAKIEGTRLTITVRENNAALSADGRMKVCVSLRKTPAHTEVRISVPPGYRVEKDFSRLENPVEI